MTDSTGDKTLISIHALAHRFASRLCNADIADDVANDVVLKCLEQMRLGACESSDSSIHNLPGLIRRMVKHRRIDLCRAERAAAKRRAKYHATRPRRHAAWSAPDLAWEERETTRLFHKVLDSLRWTHRVTYVLVRDRQLTYEQAAAHQGVDVSTVRAHMVHIRRTFRERLLAAGIVPPPPERGRAAKRKTAPPPTVPRRRQGRIRCKRVRGR